MRIIGHLDKESDARTFSDYLYVQGIKNQAEPERDGTWAIWVHAEDELTAAGELLRKFRSNPNDPEYQHAAKRARELMEQEREQEEAAAKRHFDSSEIFRAPGFMGMGPVTLTLVGISVITWLMMQFNSEAPIWDYLFISNSDENSMVNRIKYGLPEIREGQVWRVITPIFMHSPMFLHILFNMLWLRDLGTIVEYREGKWRLTSLVLATSALPNLAQYYVSGPLFYGMSGVVYGLLGYVWMKSRFDPDSGYFLHQTTVTMMLIWLVLGFTNILPMANTVHTVGLGMGVAWGYLSALNPLGRDR